MAWSRRHTKAVVIGVAVALYLLVIATRPYIAEPALAHELIGMASQDVDSAEGGIFGAVADMTRTSSSITPWNTRTGSKRSSGHRAGRRRSRLARKAKAPCG